MREVIVVGLGHAWLEFYKATLGALQNAKTVDLLGTVDPAFPVSDAETWHVQDIENIPQEAVRPDVVPIILTADHYHVIEKLAQMGFKKMMCEKPLVSRRTEIEKVQELVARYALKLYAIDFYLPKMLGLRVMRGIVGRGDPRYEWLTISSPEADFGEMLGRIESVGVQVIEAGKFCLPDIAGRPYLAKDKEVGGMVLDLITHVCGPLYQAQLLGRWRVCDASLSRLSDTTSGYLVHVADVRTEVEMYVTALLEADGIPIHLAFGKVPIEKGGLWSLEIRGNKGMYFAGLRTGQPAVLVCNDGRTVTFSLDIPTYELVIREALLYFDGLLPGFDGNYDAFLASMEVGRAILGKYAQKST
ncbi:MAG: Gfo/Idh/MocA family oxidoreductase [Minisyncoccia bacterium]|jgi:predicted dehydrogenase